MKKIHRVQVRRLSYAAPDAPALLGFMGCMLLFFCRCLAPLDHALWLCRLRTHVVFADPRISHFVLFCDVCASDEFNFIFLCGARCLF